MPLYSLDIAPVITESLNPLGCINASSVERLTAYESANILAAFCSASRLNPSVCP
jgi:hypothetical protein